MVRLSQPLCVSQQRRLIVPLALCSLGVDMLCFTSGRANKGPGTLPNVSTTQAGWRLPYLKQYLMFYITVAADHWLGLL